MTRTNIRDLTRKRLGETTASFWSNPELNTWINDGGRDIAFRTKCIKTNGYISSVDGTQEYTLTTSFSNLLAVTEVYFKQGGTTWFKMEATSKTKLDIDMPGWMSYDSGTPTEYYWDREEDLIGFIVKPDSDNAGTNYIRVYYADDFTALTDDASVPAIPIYLHQAISDYVVALGFEQRGYGDKANDAWAKYHGRLRNYMTERQREREDDEIIMVNYRNV